MSVHLYTHIHVNKHIYADCIQIHYYSSHETIILGKVTTCTLEPTSTQLYIRGNLISNWLTRLLYVVTSKCGVLEHLSMIMSTTPQNEYFIH